MTTMPFGKHKGTALTALDEDYLQWAVKNMELREPLKSALAKEVARRAQGGLMEDPTAVTESEWPEGAEPRAEKPTSAAFGGVKASVAAELRKLALRLERGE